MCSAPINRAAASLARVCSQQLFKRSNEGKGAAKSMIIAEKMNHMEESIGAESFEWI